MNTNHHDDASDVVSGALRAKWRDAASRRLGDRLHEPSDGPWFDYNQRIIMLCDALDTAEAERDQLSAQMDEADRLVDAALTDAYVRGCADIRTRVADLHRAVCETCFGMKPCGCKKPVLVCYECACDLCSGEYAPGDGRAKWPCPTALAVGIGGES